MKVTNPLHRPTRKYHSLDHLLNDHTPTPPEVFMLHGDAVDFKITIETKTDIARQIADMREALAAMPKANRIPIHLPLTATGRISAHRRIVEVASDFHRDGFMDVDYSELERRDGFMDVDYSELERRAFQQLQDEVYAKYAPKDETHD